MSPNQTPTSCPNCRQPVMVEVERLFDLNEDPQAKERMLSGASNVIQCASCGFQGQYATPIVYHDPEKELLLAFVPQELGLPRDQQERVIGPMITRVVNGLPQERRKAYLLQPKTMLTFQSLVETILEADGITKEMIQGQQDRLQLIQRMANITDNDVLTEVAKQEDAIIDEEFFTLMSRLSESALVQGDQHTGQRLTELQQQLLPITTFGRELQQQSNELEAAISSLQALGENLTREALLDLVVAAPTEARAQAYVNLVRAGMDYEFFQLLSERIARTKDEAHEQLLGLRENLLVWTGEYDQRLEAQMGEVRKFIDALVEADNLQEMLMGNLHMVNELFAQVLQQELETAQKSGNQPRFGRLQEILAILQAASEPPPEMAFINELMSVPDAKARMELLEANPEAVNEELINMLMTLVGQVESQGDAELTAKVKMLYSEVVGFSMKAKMGG